VTHAVRRYDRLVSDPIRIGISSCLLGQEVRFDGGHKRDAFLTETFGRFVEWVPVCPEVEVGMGTPREPIRLVRAEEAAAGGAVRVRLLGVKSGTDWTERMHRWSAGRLDTLSTLDLCGYVLKKDSPSCGMERVKVYATPGMPDKSGVGLFAAALLERFPHLPVEEEGRLSDPRLRDNFVERVFAYRRLRTLFAGDGRRVTWCASTPRTSSCCWRTCRRPTRRSDAWSPRRDSTRGPSCRDATSASSWVPCAASPPRSATPT
jgi:uncharacterized protein YbbK (DUF523 family)